MSLREFIPRLDNQGYRYLFRNFFFPLLYSFELLKKNDSSESVRLDANIFQLGGFMSLPIKKKKKKTREFYIID